MSAVRLHRRALSTAALVALGVVALALAWRARRAALHPPPPRPGASDTVLLITLDSTRADHLALPGGPAPYALETTPRLRRLAEQGVVYTDHVVPSNGTSAVLATLFTGLDPREHGLRSARAGDRLAEDVPTLAELLRERGYATLAGVSLPQLAADASGLARGFDRYLDVGFDEVDVALPAAELVDRAETALIELLGSDRPVFAWLHLADARAGAPLAPSEAVSWLGHHFAPWRGEPPAGDDALRDAIEHALATRGRSPAAALERLEPLVARRRGSAELRALEAARYDGSLSALDRAFGRVVRHLVEAGRGDDALVVVLATQGEDLGEGGGARGHLGLSEAVVRAPLIVRWPGGGSGAPSRALVRTADVFDELVRVLAPDVTSPSAGAVGGLPTPGAAARGDRFAESSANDELAHAWTTADLRVETVGWGTRGPLELVARERSTGAPVPLALAWPRLPIEAREAIDAARVPAELVIDVLEPLGAALRVVAEAHGGGPGALVAGDGEPPAPAWTPAGPVSARLPGAGRLRLLTVGVPSAVRLELELERGELREADVALGGRSLPEVGVARLCETGGPPWPAADEGAAIDVEPGAPGHLRVVVAGPEGAPLELRAARFPPPGPRRGAEPPLQGRAPLALEIEVRHDELLALAVAIDGRPVPASEMRLRGRRARRAGSLGLLLEPGRDAAPAWSRSEAPPPAPPPGARVHVTGRAGPLGYTPPPPAGRAPPERLARLPRSE